MSFTKCGAKSSIAVTVVSLSQIKLYIPLRVLEELDDNTSADPVANGSDDDLGNHSDYNRRYM